MSGMCRPVSNIRETIDVYESQLLKEFREPFGLESQFENVSRVFWETSSLPVPKQIYTPISPQLFENISFLRRGDANNTLRDMYSIIDIPALATAGISSEIGIFYALLGNFFLDIS